MDRFIKIGKELVAVSEEIYKEYYKMERRARYLEEDIKVGSTKIDEKTGEEVFVPSKEDSIQRLGELGVDFQEESLVEDVICDKAMLLILQEAMRALDDEEQELVQDIYYKKLTTREVAEKKNISQPAVVKRHKKVIEKIKKYFL
jgi:RNA polymerase sigma factor (sigma-70 family)